MYIVLISEAKNLYLKFGIFSNKYLIGAFIIGVLMQILVVVIDPIAKVFKLVNLNEIQWIYTICISIVPLFIMELQKKFNEVKFGKIVYPNSKKYKMKMEN